jgi:hypothetical protein
MDPTVAALTIYPAAWAALFQGLAEGIAFGLAAAASVAVIVTAVVGSLGGRERVQETIDAAGAILVIQRQTAPAAHHQPRRRCQRVASCGSID